MSSLSPHLFFLPFTRFNNDWPVNSKRSSQTVTSFSLLKEPSYQSQTVTPSQSKSVLNPELWLLSTTLSLKTLSSQVKLLASVLDTKLVATNSKRLSSTTRTPLSLTTSLNPSNLFTTSSLVRRLSLKSQVPKVKSIKLLLCNELKIKKVIYENGEKKRRKNLINCC